MTDFLPITQTDMKKRGWDRLDFVLVTGDAYVDHASFGAAIIARLLEKNGFRIGIIAQPEWTTAASFRVLGEPRFGFLITAGNIDSMVNNYTAAKKHRNDDVYAPGRQGDLRPDRAAITYSIRVREAFGRIPVILGGIEASLRRLAHYDYWQDKVRRSVLIDAGADIIVYGMGERQILEIARSLGTGTPVSEITSVPGTVIKAKAYSASENVLFLPEFEKIQTDKRAFAESFKIQYANCNPYSAKTLVETYSDCLIVQNPPSLPLSRAELDEVYELPYARTGHPCYEKSGGVPAIEEVRFSITSNRGCFGNCNFCSLTFHQGQIIQSRSHESVLREANLIIGLPDFKGYIHDVGGPTADFQKPACQKMAAKGPCPNRDCLVPVPCKNLDADHTEFLSLLRKLRALPGIKKVFLRSGLRFDYILCDSDNSFFRELVEHHVSGQLKVAPEHVSDRVLALMNKTPHSVYREFKKRFDAYNNRLGKKQYLLPYFISSHPGSTLDDAILLAEYFRDNRFIPEQVQDFYPTPGTLSTAMYHTGLDPRTMKPLYVPKSMREKAMQRALMQYRNPKNLDLVTDALRAAGRDDLIGFGRNCLVRPGRNRSRSPQQSDYPAHTRKRTGKRQRK
jgi:uncharacterized radical SAM protein YgiQ